jgi:glycosyltransferase involved in cell wall biosynthesis
VRLGFDAWGLSGDGLYTGMGRYAATLLENLPVFAPEIQVHAYGGPDEARPLWLHDSVAWRPAAGSVHRKLSALDSRLRELPRLAEEDQLDLFHAPAVHVRPSLPPVPRLRCPVVATVHDVLPLTFYRTDLPLRLRAFYRWNLRRAVRASSVVTVSVQSRDDIARLTGTDRERVAVIPNGVDFPPNVDSAVLSRLRISPPYLLFAGSYEPRKNLAATLDAYREVVRAGKPHQLVAIVERQSGHAAAIHERIRELGLEDRVRLLHSVAESDLRAVYTQAEMVLFTSLAEGFGLPPVQAAACGVPVVASDLPVLREILGTNGEFVDPRDPEGMAAAVLRLSDDEPRRRELGAGGPAVARRFSVEECVRGHIALYARAAEALARHAVATA